MQLIPNGKIYQMVGCFLFKLTVVLYSKRLPLPTQGRDRNDKQE